MLVGQGLQLALHVPSSLEHVVLGELLDRGDQVHPDAVPEPGHDEGRRQHRDHLIRELTDAELRAVPSEVFDDLGGQGDACRDGEAELGIDESDREISGTLGLVLQVLDRGELERLQSRPAIWPMMVPMMNPRTKMAPKTTI